ncbi:transposon TX1 putative 149 kDa protein, partial [Trifolium medium]|nr:transposon TX1 putative 149 kDa protein [Trifolium medium]
KALKDIGETKAPGIDGFSSKIFKASWNVIKSDVLATVHEFFDHDRLYVAVNCALVTLIPKSSDAKTMKDMRPIA